MRFMLASILLLSACGSFEVAPGSSALTNGPVCGGEVTGAVKCDWHSNAQAPGLVICFDRDHAPSSAAGCGWPERDTNAGPLYQETCVASCPLGCALMAPEEIAWLAAQHPGVCP